MLRDRGLSFGVLDENLPISKQPDRVRAGIQRSFKRGLNSSWFLDHEFF